MWRWPGPRSTAGTARTRFATTPRNVHVVAERGDELDLDSYLFVTQIIDRTPSTLSSGIVHWTLVRAGDGYRVLRQDVVLDSIESGLRFQDVEHIADRSTRLGDSAGAERRAC